MFKLSTRSMSRLEGINPDIITVVAEAIKLTKVDFGVTCGMRTVEEQEKLVASGASQTMKSKHLEGRAVDLVAYVGSSVTWQLNMYDDLADAMAAAARKLNVSVKWGAAEHYQLGDFKYHHYDILENPSELTYYGCDYFAESKKTCRKLRKAFSDKIQNAEEYFAVI